MAQRPTLNNWEIGTFFGATVIRGELNGVRVTAQLRNWWNGRFSVSYGRAWVDDIWKIGQPAPMAFAGLICGRKN